MGARSRPPIQGGGPAWLTAIAATRSRGGKLGLHDASHDEQHLDAELRSSRGGGATLSLWVNLAGVAGVGILVSMILLSTRFLVTGVIAAGKAERR